jgi:hypothetical protein
VDGPAPVNLNLEPTAKGASQAKSDSGEQDWPIAWVVLVLAVAPCPVERSVLDSASAAVGPEIDSGSVLLKVKELRNLSLRRVAGRGLKLCLLLLSVVEEG